MKKVLAFDIDQTLNVAKTPIPDEIAELLTKCLEIFEIRGDMPGDTSLVSDGPIESRSSYQTEIFHCHTATGALIDGQGS